MQWKKASEKFEKSLEVLSQRWESVCPCHQRPRLRAQGHRDNTQPLLAREGWGNTSRELLPRAAPHWLRCVSCAFARVFSSSCLEAGAQPAAAINQHDPSLMHGAARLPFEWMGLLQLLGFELGTSRGAGQLPMGCFPSRQQKSNVKGLS